MFKSIVCASALIFGVATGSHAATFQLIYDAGPGPFGNLAYQDPLDLTLEATETATAGIFEVDDFDFTTFVPYSVPYQTSSFSAVMLQTTGNAAGVSSFAADGSFLDLSLLFCVTPGSFPGSCLSGTTYIELINVANPPANSGNRYFSNVASVIGDNQVFDPNLFSITRIDNPNGGNTGSSGGGTGGSTGGGTGSSGGSGGGTGGGSVAPPSVVPLPASAWMLIAAIGALGAASRRRRTA